jgi:hypothetical protein
MTELTNNIYRVYRDVRRVETYSYYDATFDLETVLTVHYDEYFANSWNIKLNSNVSTHNLTSASYYVESMWNKDIPTNIKMMMGTLLRQAWMLWIHEVNDDTIANFETMPFTEEVCRRNIERIQSEDLL